MTSNVTFTGLAGFIALAVLRGSKSGPSSLQPVKETVATQSAKSGIKAFFNIPFLRENNLIALILSKVFSAHRLNFY